MIYLYPLIIYLFVTLLLILASIYLIKRKKAGLVRRLVLGLTLLALAAYPLYFHENSINTYKWIKGEDCSGNT